MLKSKFKVLLACAVMVFFASFAQAAVVDKGCQSVSVAAGLSVFDVEKQLPTLTIGEAQLNVVILEPAVLFEQGEERLNMAPVNNQSNLFARSRQVEKVGWRISI